MEKQQHLQQLEVRQKLEAQKIHTHLNGMEQLKHPTTQYLQQLVN